MRKHVAVVHDWLVTYAGAERVLREILALYPDADLFAVVDFLDEVDRARLFGKRATTSFVQKLPGAAKRYRGYLPLMPLAVEQLDLSGYELVISSSHAVAKGVLTGPDQLHVCYCHTPIRYAWDLQHQYLREARLQRGIKAVGARLALHYMRAWDAKTAMGVDRFIANSSYIARRIRKVYGRDAVVVHPPVDLDGFTPRADKADYYLAASRLVPYKRMDLIVQAFAAMPGKRLVVIGDGPEAAKLRALAAPNVALLLGYQPDEVLRDHLQQARAFVFAAEEDFGILPVEAQACGTPVIAYGRGGVLDSVAGHGGAAPPTGIFFHEQTVAALQAAVAKFEQVAAEITPLACRQRAEGFGPARFRAAFRAVVEGAEMDAVNAAAPPPRRQPDQLRPVVIGPRPLPVPQASLD